MSNSIKLSRVALVSAIALAFAAPTFAQSSASPTVDSGSQTKAGATATTGTTSAAPAAPATTGATGSTSKSGSATMPATSTARGAADNTNSKSGPGVADSWATTYAAEHSGRITRQAYIDEMGRRFDLMDKAKQGSMTRQAYVEDLTKKWDAMDRNNQGLTPAEVNRISGKVDVSSSAAPHSASDVQAGNMAPTSVKGK